MFEELSHNQNGFILNLNLPDPKSDGIKNISSGGDFNCKPIQEKGYSRKYSYQDIKKCFNVIKYFEGKKGKRIDWSDRGSCDNRAINSYIKLRKQNFTSLRVVALVSDSMKKCYAPEGSIYPLWLYHVANAMYCDDNKYYVLDPFLSKEKPIEFKEWEKLITYGEKDCERFKLYANNCRVKGRPTVQKSYEWTVGCSCNDVFPSKMIVTPKTGKRKNTK